MHPEAILGIEPFHFVLTLIVVGATWFLSRTIKQEGYPVWRLLLLQMGIVIVGLVGAKLFSLHLRDWHLASLSSEFKYGWNYPGALLGIILLVPVLIRFALPGFSVARYCDKLVIVTAFSLAAYRVNCFLVGCCTGAVCDGPLCLSYAPRSGVWYDHVHSGLVTHPTEWSTSVLPLHLYFMSASFFVGVFLLWFDRRRTFNGQLVLIFLLLHESSKASLEFLRVPYTQDIQLVSVAIAIAGAVGLILSATVFRRRTLVSSVFNPVSAK